MTMRRMQALDVPAAELERMKQALSPRYGSELWDPEGLALLAVRVPRDEPDLVNDLEGAVEYLAPGDVAQAKVTLFIGHQRSHIVPTPTLQGLMQARTELDRAQADSLRRSLKPGQHQVFQAPGDARRLQRLALRLPCAKVADVTETHLAPFVAVLGPLAKAPPLSQVRAVQLIADRDDVRIDADLFFQDLEEKWHEEQQRHDLAKQLATQQAAAQAAREARLAQETAAARQSVPVQSPATSPAGPSVPHTTGPATPRIPVGPRTATAPLRSHAPIGAWEGGAPDPLPPFVPPAPPQDRMGDLFEIGEPLPQTIPPAPAPPSAAATQRPGAQGAGPQNLGHRPDPAILSALEDRLKGFGYATLRSPGKHGIDLAAERAAFPSRLIAFLPAALDVATAERCLAVAKAVGADAALLVCAQADADGRRRLIATRAKWLDPAGIVTFEP